MPLPQCSSTLFLSFSTKLLLYPCCASHGLTTCTASSSSTLLNLLSPSCTFPFTGHTGPFYWCAFCGFATCATLSFFSYNGHSLHLCPFSLHLKHSATTTSYLLIIFSSTPHCITLLPNTSNLFWGTTVLFSPSFLFLQLWARCPNPLQLLHIFPFLPSSSFLSLARAHFSLSKLLINKLYCCRNMALRLYKGTEWMLSLAIYFYVCWGTRSLPSQMSTALLTTVLIIWLNYHLNREDPYSRWPSKSNCHSSVCTNSQWSVAQGLYWER